ncbi:hypothetical protein EV182_008789, partial [Spiromyces aspiralis]
MSYGVPTFSQSKSVRVQAEEIWRKSSIACRARIGGAHQLTNAALAIDLCRTWISAKSHEWKIPGDLDEGRRIPRWAIPGLINV